MGGGSSSTTRKTVTKVDRTTNVQSTQGQAVGAKGAISGSVHTGGTNARDIVSGTKAGGDVGLTGDDAVALADKLGSAVSKASRNSPRGGGPAMTNARSGTGSGGFGNGGTGGPRSGSEMDTTQIAWIVGGVLAAGTAIYFVAKKG